MKFTEVLCGFFGQNVSTATIHESWNSSTAFLCNSDSESRKTLFTTIIGIDQTLQALQACDCTVMRAEMTTELNLLKHMHRSSRQSGKWEQFGFDWSRGNSSCIPWLKTSSKVKVHYPSLKPNWESCGDNIKFPTAEIPRSHWFGFGHFVICWTSKYIAQKWPSQCFQVHDTCKTDAVFMCIFK